MKNNQLHTGNTTKKTLARARRIFSALCIVAGMTLAGLALAAGPKHPGGPAGKAPTAAGNKASDQNAIAAKYSTLVMRVYFHDRAERDALAQELIAEEVPTTGGYLTVIRDLALFEGLTARGLRVEVDEASSRNLSDPQIITDTFYNGYKTVEEIYAYLDAKVAAFPGLVEKVDIGDSWCKLHPGSCNLPAPWNGYDLYALHITNQSIPAPSRS